MWLTPAKFTECNNLGRQLADIEEKLVRWQREQQTVNHIVEHLQAKKDALLARQRELIA